jgi:phosphoribosylamine-glycine ligase
MGYLQAGVNLLINIARIKDPETKTVLTIHDQQIIELKKEIQSLKNGDKSQQLRPIDQYFKNVQKPNDIA